VVVVHDSCPDRRDGIFGTAVRVALRRAGYELRALPQSGRYARCCGSGGQVGYFDPDAGEEQTRSRLREAEATGAGILAVYCSGCALRFADSEPQLAVRHVLELLFYNLTKP
jgi:Fe-S oxidoreductase